MPTCFKHTMPEKADVFLIRQIYPNYSAPNVKFDFYVKTLAWGSTVRGLGMVTLSDALQKGP